MIYCAIFSDSKPALVDKCAICCLEKLIPDCDVLIEVEFDCRVLNRELWSYIMQQNRNPEALKCVEKWSSWDLPVDAILEQFEKQWILDNETIYQVCKLKNLYKYMDYVRNDSNLENIQIAEVKIPDEISDEIWQHDTKLYHSKGDLNFHIREFNLAYILELEERGLIIEFNNDEKDYLPTASGNLLMRIAIAMNLRDVLIYLIDKYHPNLNIMFSIEMRDVGKPFEHGTICDYIRFALMYNNENFDTIFLLLLKGCTQFYSMISECVILDRDDILLKLATEFDLSRSFDDSDHMMMRLIYASTEVLQKYISIGFRLTDNVIRMHEVSSESTAMYLINADLGLDPKLISNSIAELAYRKRGALLEYLESHNYFDKDYASDLKFATKCKDRYMIDYLFAKGIDVKEYEKKIAYALKYMRKRHKMFFEVFLEYGVDFNSEIIMESALYSLNHVDTDDQWIDSFNFLVENSKILEWPLLLFQTIRQSNRGIYLLLTKYTGYDINHKIRSNALEKLNIYCCGNKSFANDFLFSIIEVFTFGYERNEEEVDTYDEIVDSMFKAGLKISDEELTEILARRIENITYQRPYLLLMKLLNYLTMHREFHFEHPSLKHLERRWNAD